MNKTNGRSDQPISTRSKNEVAETLDTPKSATTRYGVHSENNDTLVLMIVKTQYQLFFGIKNQIFQTIGNHVQESEEKCLKTMTSGMLI